MGKPRRLTLLNLLPGCSIRLREIQGVPQPFHCRIQLVSERVGQLVRLYMVEREQQLVELPRGLKESVFVRPC